MKLPETPTEDIVMGKVDGAGPKGDSELLEDMADYAKRAGRITDERNFTVDEIGFNVAGVVNILGGGVEIVRAMAQKRLDEALAYDPHPDVRETKIKVLLKIIDDFRKR